MLKLFVSDIDGTLMDTKKVILDEDVRAIREANREGVAICLASGRMHEEIRQVVKVLDVPCYAICQNGATIVGLNGEIVRSHTFETERALSVLRTVQQQPDLVPVICTAEGNYVIELTPEARQVGQRFLTPLREMPTLVDAIQQGMPITKFSIYGAVPILEDLLGHLGSIYGNQVTASFSDPDGVDVMPESVDKGVGLQLLMNLVGVQEADVACIGDSFNDLAMFRACAQSFAMAHAPAPVQREAAFVAHTVGEALTKVIESR